jgi:hypothetical protein
MDLKCSCNTIIAVRIPKILIDDSGTDRATEVYSNDFK